MGSVGAWENRGLEAGLQGERGENVACRGVNLTVKIPALEWLPGLGGSLEGRFGSKDGVKWGMGSPLRCSRSIEVASAICSNTRIHLPLNKENRFEGEPPEKLLEGTISGIERPVSHLDPACMFPSRFRSLHLLHVLAPCPSFQPSWLLHFA